MSASYGRVYKLVVYDQSGTVSTTYSSSDFGPNALKMQFEVEQSFNAIWQASITIWNLNTPTQTNFITSSARVELYAGYVGNNGLIFAGTVLQPLFERDGPDYKTTLICIFDMLGREFSKGTITAGQTQTQYLAQMAAGSKRGQIATMPGQIRTDNYIRGKAWFGSVRTLTQQVARDNDLTVWRTRTGLAVGQIKADGQPSYTFAPVQQGRQRNSTPGVNYTIIGEPQQTTNGVNLLVQLDPRIAFQAAPPLVIKLTETLIRVAPVAYGNAAIIPLTADATYAVASVRHFGDTRGDEWATEITCVVPGGFGQILQQYNQQSQ